MHLSPSYQRQCSVDLFMTGRIELVLSVVSLKLELRIGYVRRSWRTVEGNLFLYVSDDWLLVLDQDAVLFLWEKSYLVTVSSLCLDVKWLPDWCIAGDSCCTSSSLLNMVKLVIVANMENLDISLINYICTSCKSENRETKQQPQNGWVTVVLSRNGRSFIAYVPSGRTIL